MSMVFGLYSRYYDLLYQDKDYAAEAAYVSHVMRRFAPAAEQVLELGSGTGKHAALLSAAGWKVTGVERSEQMIGIAKERARDVKVVCGDARTVRLGRQFDAVISLFHVVSYQTSDEDVEAIFRTAATHLKDRGIFLFDVWHGPAVLEQMPQPRTKQIQDDRIAVRRTATPETDLAGNVVHVTYDVEVTDISDGSTTTLNETHSMRYFFSPEIDMFARAAGFQVVQREEWLSGAPPSPQTWGVAYVLQKNGPAE